MLCGIHRRKIVNAHVNKNCNKLLQDVNRLVATSAFLAVYDSVYEIMVKRDWNRLRDMQLVA